MNSFIVNGSYSDPNCILTYLVLIDVSFRIRFYLDLIDVSYTLIIFTNLHKCRTIYIHSILYIRQWHSMKILYQGLVRTVRKSNKNWLIKNLRY